MVRSGTWAVAGGVVLGLGVIATVAMVTLGRGPGPSACRQGATAGDIGGPFTLIDEDGRTVTDADVITAPTIVYFGYTFCPDVCPTDSARNAFALEDLEARGIIANALFISIDPARDTPEVVKAFTAGFHERMLGLTGSEEQVAAAARAYRAFYQKDDSGDPDYYLMNHSTYSYLTMPGTGFADFFTRETTPEEMADRVACFTEEAGLN
ncbi:MAG: SCO family protein [Rubellimicrobium sp.]|nr:SCO family protein [Rubellimicrobium sp.]